MTDEIAGMTISELAPLIRARKVSPVEVTQAVLDRIERFDPLLNAYITVDAEGALKAARAAQRQIAAGKYSGPLHGIPISLKDLFDAKGLKTTAGSKILADRIADRDAPSVAALRAAGAVILGKTNLHEFAFGSTTQNPHYGGTRNPYDLSRIPGGSSGGSAAAVAADLCVASTGTDTGGSIRTPSALCGTVGLKPTYGRVSLRGIVPLAWSLDHAGPIAKCVRDAALLLAAMAAPDPLDPTSAQGKVPSFIRTIQGGVRSLKIGVDPAFCFNGVDEEIAGAVENALKLLEKKGARIREVKIPSIELAVIAESVIITVEAASFHESNLRSRAVEYGLDVRALLEGGAAFSAVHYLKAQRLRRVLQEEFARAFEKMDLFALPSAPVAAPPIGEASVSIAGAPSDLETALLRFACPGNLTGLPAISIPCGLDRQGLPMGLQLLGRAFDEATVLRAAWAYENLRGSLPKPTLSSRS